MADEVLSPARLIPANGIRGAKEQEQRSTSALLAVMQAVPGFGRSLFSVMGAPAGRISTFVEPRFTTNEGATVIPDGLVLVERGKTRWVALVEVKTGGALLDALQVDKYLQVAMREGFQGVLTISNQIVASPADPPVRVDGRKTRKVVLRHLSWFRILTEAVTQSENRGVTDPEQAWILRELIAFLNDERSGAGGLDGMGKSWVKVREAARSRTVSVTDAAVRDVAETWEQFLEYLALRLRQSLGNPVAIVHPKKSSHATRTRGYVDSLAKAGALLGVVKVPDAVDEIDIEARLAALQTTTSTVVPAPRKGRARTRINWLLRQLHEAPPDLRIEVQFQHVRSTTTALLREANARPEVLFHPEDRHREPRSFALSLTRDMGTKRGRGQGSFVGDTTQQVADFYRGVVQNLEKWTPKPPRLPVGKPDEPAPKVSDD